jgi:uncharacterized protein YcaQ
MLELRELWADGNAGESVMASFGGSDWWSWKAGSTLIFWRWPAGEQRTAARDGMRAYIRSAIPLSRKAAKPPKADQSKAIFEKLLKILRRGYFKLSRNNVGIKSLTDYFGVPKADDIRIVFNGMSCG